MSRMVCRCGEILSTVQAPNDIQLRVFTDKEWDEIIQSDTIHPWLIPQPTYDVWRCPTCKRLYFFKNGSDDPEIVYAVEKDTVSAHGAHGGRFFCVIQSPSPVVD